MKQSTKLNNEIANEYKITGRINREKDKEAAKQFFIEDQGINTKLRYFITDDGDYSERINYLKDNDYYERAFLEKYTQAFINELYKIANSFKYRFPSFMSASKFYDGYAMKSRNEKEVLERYEDRNVITALYLADGDETFAKTLLLAIMTAYQPATPTYLNSGKSARGELVSCFKLTMDDSMNSIAENIGYCLELSRLGGGVGVNLTDLRPQGDPIKGIENRASGVMPVAKLLENSFSYSNQLGQRNGSGVAYLNIFHADIESFISAKKPNADEKIRLATLSTGIIVPDVFFEKMKEDKDIYLFSSYDIERAYGKRMSEISITEMYDELIENPNIRKISRINARQLYTQVKQAQFESGYPFELFDDNTNNQHALKNIGRVKMSNLCTEIMQVQETSVITDQDVPNKYGLDVSCNLGSIDIHAATKVDDFGQLIRTASAALTVVAEKTHIVNVPSVAKANDLMRSVGLGVMNLHSHLAANEIFYGSKDSIEFVDRFMEAVNFFTLVESMNKAKETKSPFYRFEASDYASGVYFEKYVTKEDTIPSEAVLKALGNVPLITAADWQELSVAVQEYGLYNAYRQAIAPTGSISYVRNCSASIAPITERVEIRDYADSRTFYPMPLLTDDNQKYFKTAYEMNQYRMIDVYAAAQKHVDQGISMTLYVTDDWTTAELTKLYYYAWKKGIKSVYYVRQKIKDVEQSIEECVACQI